MKKKYMLLGVLILSIILFVINGFSYAKYISNSIWNYYLSSKGFYFESEDLSADSKKNVNNMWDGESTYFSITNSLNDALATESDINYTVTCTVENSEENGNLCYLNGTNSNIYSGILSGSTSCVNMSNDGVNVSSYTKTECEMNGYNWTNQVAYKDIYFDVVNKDGLEVADATVNIEVKTTSPYEKILLGKFILHRVDSNDGKLYINYNSYSDYEEVTVSNSTAYDKCGELIWDDSNFIIDDNNFLSYKTNTDGYIEKIVFNINTKNSLIYRFYKRNLENSYDISAFSLVESEECN